MKNSSSKYLNRRGFLTVTGMSAGGLLLAACGGNSITATAQSTATFGGEYTGPDVKLNFWNGFTGGDGPIMDKMVSAFNDAHPNINVTTTSMVWADFYSKIVTAVTSGVGPEVAVMQMDQLATFAIRGTIVPLDSVADNLELTSADFTQSVWDGSVFQEKRYGIPLDMFTIAQYWDTKQFAKAGITGPINGADNFSTAMKELQNTGVKNPCWIPTISPHWQIFTGLLKQNGGSLYDSSSEKVTFNSDAGVQALTWMVEQVTDGVSPQGVTDGRTPLKNGTASVLIDGLWSISDLNLTAANLDWGIDAFPTIGETPGAFANSHNFTLTAQADKDENKGQASRVFLDWMSRNSADWAASGNIPARASARSGDDFMALPQAKLATEENFNNFVFLPQIPTAREIATNSYQRAVSEAVLGTSKPADALAEAAKSAQSLLDSARKQYGL